MVARSTTLQSEAGYIDARPQSRQVDENLLRRTAGPYIWVILRPMGRAIVAWAIGLVLLDEPTFCTFRLSRLLNHLSTAATARFAALSLSEQCCRYEYKPRPLLERLI